MSIFYARQNYDTVADALTLETTSKNMTKKHWNLYSTNVVLLNYFI